MKNTNWTYLSAKAGAYGYLGFALYLSFNHIIALFAGWGSHTPWVAPLLLDTLMLLGRLIRSPKFAPKTRKVGLGLQIGAAMVSLTANVLAGDNFGDQVLGVLVIGGLLVVEWVVEQVKPAETDTVATQQAVRSAAAQKAAATRKANAAEKAEAAARKAQAAADRRERRRLAAAVAKLEVAFDGADAPVSPAPAPGYL